ncbi:hypothetical protein GN316_07555 [Xylophilus sp. Kf1]|nr:hypothetical protein [Xylophilus sp. Kf1]
MNEPEKIFIHTDDYQVTSEEVSIEGRKIAVRKIMEARVGIDSSYRFKTVPFVLAMGFVIWTLSELVNGTADYTYAAIAAILAILSMAAVRLIGRLQKHTAVLTLSDGSSVDYRSHEKAAVIALVRAINQARDSHAPHYAQAWKVRQSSAAEV